MKDVKILRKAQRIYVNPKFVEVAKNKLQEFAKHNKTVSCLLAEYMKTNSIVTPEDKEIYYRAAKKLKWFVFKSKGKVFDNGEFLWEDEAKKKRDEWENNYTQ